MCQSDITRISATLLTRHLSIRCWFKPNPYARAERDGQCLKMPRTKLGVLEGLSISHQRQSLGEK